MQKLRRLQHQKQETQSVIIEGLEPLECIFCTFITCIEFDITAIRFISIVQETMVYLLIRRETYTPMWSSLSILVKDSQRLKKCALCRYIYASESERISHLKLDHPSACIYCHKILFTSRTEHIMRGSVSFTTKKEFQ